MRMLGLSPCSSLADVVHEAPPTNERSATPCSLSIADRVGDAEMLATPLTNSSGFLGRLKRSMSLTRLGKKRSRHRTADGLTDEDGMSFSRQ